MEKTRSESSEVQRQRILDAAEAVLRRHGPAKTTVVDVAKVLGQSHASVYRYFTGKADLFDALVERWLERFMPALEAITSSDRPADDRLRAWLVALYHAKREKLNLDPEHFANYQLLAEQARRVVGSHMRHLFEQVESIVLSGIREGMFRVSDPSKATLAILNGTIRFHHPALLASKGIPPTQSDLNDVITLLLAGLREGVI